MAKPESTSIQSFAVYREHAARVAGPHKNDYFALGLCEEAGEVAGVVKKHVFHGHELNRDKLVEELGDTLWYLDQLACSFGITLEEVAGANIEKLRKRYPSGFSQG